MNLIRKTNIALKTHFPHIETAPRFFRAPGRVNLIGEHTDYNQGFVLPVALNFETVVAAIPRHDTIVTIIAVDKQETDQFDLSEPIEPEPTKPWANYVRGMVKVLQADFTDLHGINLAIAGNVPTSGGLSSSASLEMALGYAVLQLNDKPVDGVKLALSGQKAENEFVGVQCGIMDQFISALGQKDYALLIDCQDLSYTPVPIPPDTAIVVVDSGVQRGLVDSEYNIRRQQCERAAAHFGLTSLRQLDVEAFNKRRHELDPIIRRRATHVITENARTLAMANALTAGKMTELGPLMTASHQSMRDDFEITVPAIDTLVDIMQQVPGVYGARMTGGGFGGCCVALAPVGIALQVANAVKQYYCAKTGYQATIYQCHAATGAGET